MMIHSLIFECLRLVIFHPLIGRFVLFTRPKYVPYWHLAPGYPSGMCVSLIGYALLLTHQIMQYTQKRNLCLNT